MNGCMSVIDMLLVMYKLLGIPGALSVLALMNEINPVTRHVVTHCIEWYLDYEEKSNYWGE